MKYIKRLLFDEIKKWIGRKEIIAIRGPRQSGKTTLLKILSEWLADDRDIDENHIIYITFEDRGQLDAFSQNPNDFMERLVKDKKTHYVLLDEAQYCPDLGQKLKLVYDLFDNVKLVITGSSSLELKNQTGKYLVGRLLEFDLMPLNFYEYLNYADEGLARMYLQWHERVMALISEGRDFDIKKDPDILAKEMLKHLDTFVTFGGYPAVVAADGKDEKEMLLRNMLNNYIDKDIVSFLQITDTIKFRKLVTAIAASDGSMIKMEELATQIGSYFKELSKLIDVLEQTYVIRRISPYHKNLLTELKKARKTYFVDIGLRNALIENFSSLENRPDAGVLAENFILNEIFEHSKVHFWRTTAKTEVDFVAEGKSLLPIEAKFQHFANAKVNKSLYGFLGEYKPAEALMITRDFWGERSFKQSKIKFVPICYM